LDGGDFGDAVFEVSFDADAEGHVGGGAAYACAVHADFDDAIVGDFDEFDVAAVVLDGWSDAVDDECDAFVEVFALVVGVVWLWHVVDCRMGCVKKCGWRAVEWERRAGRATTLWIMMNQTKSCWTGKLRVVVLGVCISVLGVGALGGCSGGGRYATTGNPLLDLRNPELLERDRVQAAEQAWEEVERGVRVRERTRKALKNLAWSNATSPGLRVRVLELLMSDESAEGSADSRTMARLLLPTERSPDAVRVMASAAVEGGWTELTPALVRSYARVSPNVPDIDRDERAALISLSGGDSIEEIVFEAFLKPTTGIEDEREQVVLRLAQRTRDDAWGLLSRLDPNGDLRRLLIESEIDEDSENASRVLVADLRAAMNDFGVMPESSMQIQWLTNLRHHSDPRNERLNGLWWAQVKEAVAGLGGNQRAGLGLGHLEAVRWAAANRPAWLALDRDGLFGVASTRMSQRKHLKRKSQKGEGRRLERLGDWAGVLSWGDLLTVLVVDDALGNAGVVDQIFRQRALDTKDESTEYGGVIEADAEDGFRAVLYRPRMRDRMNDERFVASDDMFRFSDRALVHYHMHANKRNNGRYAGPSLEDLANAKESGRANLVFTSLGDDELNVDVYFPNGAVIDLGRIYQAE